MIGVLIGVVGEVFENGVILQVGGVGYIVYVSHRTLEKCIKGVTLRLYIETSVNRENVPQLYGFITTEERNCLKLLIKVNGINYKTALTILDKLTPDQIYSAIINEDKASIKVSGLGERIISRIFTELGPIVQKLEFNMSLKKATSYESNDALAALLGLGYEKTKILHVLEKLGTAHSLSDTVRYALKELSK